MRIPWRALRRSWSMKGDPKKFVEEWSAREGRERGEAQAFWLSHLGDVLEVDAPKCEIDFEVPVKIDGRSKQIDGYIKRTRVLIEHKSAGVDLDRPGGQSDEAMLTPFQQAKRYADNLAFSRSD